MALRYPNIEAERARQGYKRLELADRLGVTTKTIQNWQKKAGAAIPADKLCILCDLFGCSADYLLGRAER